MRKPASGDNPSWASSVSKSPSFFSVLNSKEGNSAIWALSGSTQIPSPSRPGLHHGLVLQMHLDFASLNLGVHGGFSGHGTTYTILSASYHILPSYSTRVGSVSNSSPISRIPPKLLCNSNTLRSFCFAARRLTHPCHVCESRYHGTRATFYT
jgi:hypothetical protein